MKRSNNKAIKTKIYNHLKNNNETVNDYDLIITGDLGIYGKKILKEYMNQKYKIILGSINNKTCDLNTEVNRDSKIDFYDYSSKIGNNSYQKGLSFLFSKAVRSCFLSPTV